MWVCVQRIVDREKVLVVSGGHPGASSEEVGIFILITLNPLYLFSDGFTLK